MPITNPLLKFTADFYRADVRRGVEIILRRRCVEAELKRAAERHKTQQKERE